MRNRNRNHSNALQHGAFAKTAILPGEDPAEFEELHSVLIQEWTPVGPTEEDAVLSIAKGVWRKRRAQKLLQARILSCRFDPEHPLYDEGEKVLRLFYILETAPIIGLVDVLPEVFDRFYDGVVPKFLTVRQAKYLDKKCPRENFKSGSAWLRAVRNEILFSLLPSYWLLGEWPDVLLSRAAEFLTPDVFRQELAVDERVDAMIDRAVKRLVQTKAIKQMLDHPSPNGKDRQQIKARPSGKPNGPTKLPTKASRADSKLSTV